MIERRVEQGHRLGAPGGDEFDAVNGGPSKNAAGVDRASELIGDVVDLAETVSSAAARGGEECPTPQRCGRLCLRRELDAVPIRTYALTPTRRCLVTVARSTPTTTLTVVAMVGVALWVGVGAGQAAWVDCTRAAATVTAITDASSPDTLSVGAGGAILANDVACADATTANTDLIQIVDDGLAAWVAAPDITIDLSGGPFAPGATDEPGSSSDEIELHLQFDRVALPLLTVAGSSGADHVVAGAGGLNLNAAEPDDDVDLPRRSGRRRGDGARGGAPLARRGPAVPFDGELTAPPWRGDQRGRFRITNALTGSVLARRLFS